MDKKISIIVPVFNVENYLKRCVESLINQTYKNIEILLIDDKSSDSSPKLCDELAKTDQRIKVVHKEKNEGLGFARNTGIENASGDYLMFIDSDDYIDLNTCMVAKEALEKYGADICCYFWADVFKNDIEKRSIISETLVYENEQIARDFLAYCIAPKENENNKEYGISACTALYSAELIKENNVRFVSEREFINEDMLFRIELCKHIKKAVLIPDNLYYYFHNHGTLTTKFKENRFEESVKMFKKVCEMCSFFNCEELYKRNIRYFLINTLVCIKQEVAHRKRLAIPQIKKICLNACLINAISEYPIGCMPIQQRLFFIMIKNGRAKSVYLLTAIKLLTEKNINS